MNKTNEILEALMKVINIYSTVYDLDTNEGQLGFAQEITDILRERGLIDG